MKYESGNIKLNNVSLPDIGKNGKKIKHAGQVHVRVPTFKPFMIKIIDEALVCVSCEIDGKTLD